MVATQGAFWRYGRSGYAFKKFNGENASAKARMELIFTWLTSDYLKNKVGTASQIIDEDSFFDPDSIKLTVKGKVADHNNNKDHNADDGGCIYTKDLSTEEYLCIRKQNLTFQGDLYILLLSVIPIKIIDRR